MKRGFTLIELLVAVLIIGVLTAMALPMYQKSVDKSRYATLMPLAKNIKDAQEAFYLGGGKYSQDLGSLDVRVPGNPSGNTATLSDGTTVEISTTDGYGYVKLSKNNLNNNYIIYQDRSANYPGEIHCEALSDNDRANELCQNLGGQKISGSLTDGYTTYILSGTGAGVAPELNQEAENGGSNWQSCDTYPCTKPCGRDVRSGYICEGTYQEDGTYTEKVCTDNEEVCITTDYDENGKRTTWTLCWLDTESGTCTERGVKTYDAQGNMLSENNIHYTYDEEGNKTARFWCEEYSSGEIYCSGYRNVYDGNGNLIIADQYCQMNSDGECTGEIASNGTAYEYDENGRVIKSGICGQIESDFSCSDWNEAESTYYTYDENGKISSEKKGGWEQTYDENGRVTSSSICYDYDAEGTCTQGASGITTYSGNTSVMRECSVDGCPSDADGTYEIYDANGNRTALLYCYGVGGIQADGSCPGGYTNSAFYEYDELGRETVQYSCDTEAISSNGTCSAPYTSAFYKVYEEDGSLVAQYWCNNPDGNGGWGWCSQYMGPDSM